MNYHFEQIDHSTSIACLNNVSVDEIREIISRFKEKEIIIKNVIENDPKPSNNGRYYTFKIILDSTEKNDKILDFRKLVEGLLLSYKRARKTDNNLKGDFDSLYNLNMKLFDKINQLENNLLLNNEKFEQIAERNKLEIEYIIKSINTGKIDNSVDEVSKMLEEANSLIEQQKKEIENKNNELIAKNELINQQRNKDYGINIPENIECGIIVYGSSSMSEIDIDNLIKTSLIHYCKPKIDIISTDYDETKKGGKNLSDKFKSGKYKYLIYGPMPHSRVKNNLKNSIVSEAQRNGIICYGDYNKELNKSKLQGYVEEVIRQLYSKETK